MPTRTAQDPTRLLLIFDDQVLPLEWYGGSPKEDYFKTRRPGGGTIEVHLLLDSSFEDHPDGWGERAERIGPVGPLVGTGSSLLRCLNPHAGPRPHPRP